MFYRYVGLISLALVVTVSGCMSSFSNQQKLTTDICVNATNKTESFEADEKLTDAEKNLQNSNIRKESPNDSKIIEVDSFDFNQTIIQRDNESLAFYNTLNEPLTIVMGKENIYPDSTTRVKGNIRRKVYSNQYFRINTTGDYFYYVSSESSPNNELGFVLNFPEIGRELNQEMDAEEIKRKSDISISEVYESGSEVSFNITNTGSVPIPLYKEYKPVIVTKNLGSFKRAYNRTYTATGYSKTYWGDVKVDFNIGTKDQYIEKKWKFDPAYYSTGDRIAPARIYPNSSIQIVSSEIDYPKEYPNQGYDDKDVFEKKRFTVISTYESKVSHVCSGETANCLTR